MMEMAFGLTRQQRECLLKMATSNMYYERYLANKFNVSDAVVRIICAEEGNYVCKRLDKQLKHYDGYYLPAEGED